VMCSISEECFNKSQTSYTQKKRKRGKKKTTNLRPAQNVECSQLLSFWFFLLVLSGFVLSVYLNQTGEASAECSPLLSFSISLLLG